MFAHPPLQLTLLGPGLLLLAACEADLQVDLSVTPPSSAISSVSVELPSLELLDSRDGASSLAVEQRLQLLDHVDGERARLAADSGEADIRYTGVRLQFSDDEAEVTLASGSRVPLQLDDASHPAALDLRLDAGDAEDLIVVMDLRFSLIDRRHDLGHYRLRPVLRAAPASATGTLEGSVASGLLQDSDCRQGRPLGEGVAVYVYAGSEREATDYYDNGTVMRPHPPLASAPVRHDPDHDAYRYAIHYLAAGEYTVALTCEADQERPDADDDLLFVDSRDAEITTGATARADFGE